MLYDLKKAIEDKRGSDSLFWMAAVAAKDIGWVCTEAVSRLPRPVWLRRADRRKISISPGELLAFMVVRNEAVRLPYLLDYYSGMGVDRFFIADNGSTDGTMDLLLARPDTHAFRAIGSYKHSRYGNRWLRRLLKRYGEGHWCLAVDADEMFIYPHYETVDLKGLCRFLDTEKSDAVSSLLLDMYSDGPIREAPYKPGEPLIQSFPWFDGSDEHIRVEESVGRDWHKGGARRRVFGIETLLDKTCLFRYAKGMEVMEGQHSVDGAKLSEIKGSVLHFKYLSDFGQTVMAEARREEHWANASEYKGMARGMVADPDLSMHHPGSVRFDGSGQLVDMGIMRTTESFDRFADM